MTLIPSDLVFVNVDPTHREQVPDVWSNTIQMSGGLLPPAPPAANNLYVYTYTYMQACTLLTTWYGWPLAIMMLIFATSTVRNLYVHTCEYHDVMDTFTLK